MSYANCIMELTTAESLSKENEGIREREVIVRKERTNSANK